MAFEKTSPCWASNAQYGKKTPARLCKVYVPMNMLHLISKGGGWKGGYTHDHTT